MSAGSRRTWFHGGWGGISEAVEFRRGWGGEAGCASGTEGFTGTLWRKRRERPCWGAETTCRILSGHTRALDLILWTVWLPKGVTEM